MINVLEKKEKIVSYLRDNGPTLPVTISKIIEMDPFFASAILSEVLGEKRVKASYMRVGSSPLYFLEGQENQLEKFSSNLKSAERAAFEKLKDKKVLTDSEEEPAIRVALRLIRDFAIPFDKEGKLMWRYAFMSEEEAEKMILPKKVEVLIPEEKPKEEIKEEEIKKREPKKERKEKIPPKISESIVQTQEDKSEFFKEIKKFLEGKNIEFLEEIQSDKKEVVAKVSIDSSVGRIKFLMIAKDKKNVSKEEISMAIQRATYSKMPCFMVIRKKPTKTIENYVSENNLVKIESLD